MALAQNPAKIDGLVTRVLKNCFPPWPFYLLTEVLQSPRWEAGYMDNGTGNFNGVRELWNEATKWAVEPSLLVHSKTPSLKQEDKWIWWDAEFSAKGAYFKIQNEDNAVESAIFWHREMPTKSALDKGKSVQTRDAVREPRAAVCLVLLSLLRL
ncbi:hypothetical protein Ancab_017232 [Ancistrocladus abbreviatus]